MYVRRIFGTQKSTPGVSHLSPLYIELGPFTEF